MSTYTRMQNLMKNRKKRIILLINTAVIIVIIPKLFLKINSFKKKINKLLTSNAI